MRKQHFLIIIFILLVVSVSGQKKFNIQVRKNTEGKMNSVVKTQFYCIDAEPDSLFLNSDSLMFSKLKINENFPELILYDNFKFCFSYKIHIDTIKVATPKDNSVLTKVIMTAKELKGDWNTIDLHKQIKLIFKNSINNYKVIETDKLIYFIKSNK